MAEATVRPVLGKLHKSHGGDEREAPPKVEKYPCP